LAASEFLAAHPRVKKVHYPGLSTHPQHGLARRQMKDFGTVVSLDLDGGLSEGARFAESLELFSITPSVGSTESLVMPPQLLGGRDYTPAQRVASAVGPGTVRLSIGLEDPSDVRADLEQALAQAFA
jgi:cystathionine beta-lyase/cystathionine gamma-synthase